MKTYTPDELAAILERHAIWLRDEEGGERANLGFANLCSANLRSADLSYADLRYADLVSANLCSANLRSADLRSADLGFANLCSANLRSADLSYADLSYADLGFANLCSANLGSAFIGRDKDAQKLILIGERPIFSFGPIGSRSAYLVAFITDEGIRLRAGCFFGTVKEFKAKLTETHGDNIHAQEYTAALKMVAAHAKLWTPK